MSTKQKTPPAKEKIPKIIAYIDKNKTNLGAINLQKVNKHSIYLTIYI